jgi:hypothetical protein
MVTAVIYALIIHKAATEQIYYKCTTKAVISYNQNKNSYSFDFSEYPQTNVVTIYCNRIGPSPYKKDDEVHVIVRENDLVVETSDGGYIWEPSF